VTTDHHERPGAELVADYLRDLESQAARLPWNTRQELLEDVRSHIEVALDESGSGDAPDRAAVLRILGSLGDPSEIVGAALADAPPDPAPPAPLPGSGLAVEATAVVLLLFGGFLFLVGWFVGVGLLWTSQRWTLRDKLIGTFVLPGGLAFVGALGAFSVGSVSCDGTSLTPSQCAAHGSASWPSGVGPALFVLCLVLPLISAFYLGRRARRSATPVRTGPEGLRPVLAVMLTVVFGVLALAVIGVMVFLLSSGSSTRHVGPTSDLVVPSAVEAPTPSQSR
jgi:hypothetical protein